MIDIWRALSARCPPRSPQSARAAVLTIPRHTMSSGRLETKKSGDFYWSKDEVRRLPCSTLPKLRVARRLSRASPVDRRRTARVA